MSIKAAIRHRLGSFDLDAAFEASGRLTAIFGASGSGKTTIINAIAGLFRPQSAYIEVDGTVLADTKNGIALPAHRRRIGYVFQDARLFPHLSVAQNLNYGVWFTSRSARYASREQIVALLGIGHLLARKPNQLSGGEKQRVAIGRALLSSPRLLLMDEPLAALDQPRKQEILPFIERLRDEMKIPIVYVSHSVAEVARLATDIVVLADGKVAAAGSAPVIMQRLDLVPPEERQEGGAIVEMKIEAFDEHFAMTTMRSAAGEMHVPGRIGPNGSAARLHIRARDVMVATSEPRNISALNILRGTVAALAGSGSPSMTVTIDCAGVPIVARITRQSAAALRLVEGMPVFALVKAVSVAGSGTRSY